jgi:hypothetical protein
MSNTIGGAEPITRTTARALCLTYGLTPEETAEAIPE